MYTVKFFVRNEDATGFHHRNNRLQTQVVEAENIIIAIGTVADHWRSMDSYNDIDVISVTKYRGNMILKADSTYRLEKDSPVSRY